MTLPNPLDALRRLLSPVPPDLDVQVQAATAEPWEASGDVMRWTPTLEVER